MTHVVQPRLEVLRSQSSHLCHGEKFPTIFYLFHRRLGPDSAAAAAAAYGRTGAGCWSGTLIDWERVSLRFLAPFRIRISGSESARGIALILTGKFSNHITE